MTSADDRRELILRSTIACIVRSGYDGVRLRDVSKQAGVSVGMIQHYFETRDELVAQAIGYLSADLIEQFFSAEAQPVTAWGRIEAMIEQVCAVTDLSEHSYMWLALGGAVFRHPELRPELEKVYGAWDAYTREALALGIATGEFDPVGEADDVIAAYLAFFDGYEYDMSTGLIPPDPVELRRRSLLLARALFRPASGAARS